MEKKQITGFVSAKLIAAAAICKAESNEVRYYLGGIYVEPHPKGGVMVVASNGHHLFCGHDIRGSISEPVIFDFSKRFITDCAKAKPNGLGDRELIVEFDGRLAYLSVGRLSSAMDDVQPGLFEELSNHSVPAIEPIQTINAEYPNWRKVVPNKTAGAQLPVSYYLKYLSNLEKVAKALGIPEQARAATAYGVGKTLNETKCSPTVFTFDYPGADALIIIMPRRTDDVENGIPDWLPPPADKKVKA